MCIRDSYTVVLSAKGDGRMLVTMVVDGVGVQDKIGVSKIDIDEKVNGKWQYYDTLYAVDHPEFYDYNTRDYLGDVSFYGTPGNSYRVTLLVYACLLYTSPADRVFSGCASPQALTFPSVWLT